MAVAAISVWAAIAGTTSLLREAGPAPAPPTTVTIQPSAPGPVRVLSWRRVTDVSDLRFRENNWSINRVWVQNDGPEGGCYLQFTATFQGFDFQGKIHRAYLMKGENELLLADEGDYNEASSLTVDVAHDRTALKKVRDDWQ